jgi:hypothetical protein
MAGRGQDVISDRVTRRFSGSTLAPAVFLNISSRMNRFFSAQEMARRNNENVAVFAAYQRRRRLRRLAGKKTKCTAKELDDLDWLATEREARPVRAVGFFLART